MNSKKSEKTGIIEKIIGFLKAYDKPVKIMEVCGTHTSSIVKSGIRNIISPSIRLVSGPGCPVCVTVPGYIDKLVDFGFADNCRVLSFGDLVKVKGNGYSLWEAKSAGAKIDVIYSPFEAVGLAEKNRDINFAVAAVGFETTVPVYAALLEEIISRDIKNIKFLTSLKAALPAISYICEREQIDGFICPGHVSVITGSGVYEELSKRYNKPFVISGFEPEHIIAAIYGIVRQLDDGARRVDNQYKSVVKTGGNQRALNLANKYFVIPDSDSSAAGCSVWRGIGAIENSSYVLKDEYGDYDLGSRLVSKEPLLNGCRCGDVMLGRILPDECELFGKKCTPGNAVGACMVSTEGACGIFYGSSGKR